MLKTVHIKAVTLDDAWFQALYAILDHGRLFVIDQGSNAGQKRLQFDHAEIHIERPWERDVNGEPFIPVMPDGCSIPPPVAPGYVAQYYAEKLFGCVKSPNEQYTYGERLIKGSVFTHRSSKESSWITEDFVDQVQTLIDRYRIMAPTYQSNQMILQVAQPSDITLEDPPCLRHIDTMIIDGRLHFYPSFRSWDLWGGFPANLAGISLLQEYMAGEIGVLQGEIIATSGGLHLYDYAVDLAEVRCMRLAN
ncbi:MAG: thymidylate synthase [Desulfobacterales bacterium]|nr:thymidylate synthase [Desulfobacterales bacterium]